MTNITVFQRGTGHNYEVQIGTAAGDAPAPVIATAFSPLELVQVLHYLAGGTDPDAAETVKRLCPHRDAGTELEKDYPGDKPFRHIDPREIL